MTEKFFTYQSTKIFYRKAGKGKSVVLLHGFAEDGDVWNRQVEFLKDHLPAGQAGFLLIIPDLPGSGRSGLIEDMSMEGMAETIHALLAEEKIEQCCMLGHSMGGYITLAVAEKYPHLLSSFGLVHSSAFADSEEKKANRLKSIEFVKKNGAFEFLKATIISLFTEQWYEDNRQQVNAIIEKSRNFTDEAIIKYYQAIINRPDRTPVLKNFSNPILFIIGEHDQAVPFQQSLQQCYLPRRSHIHILRHSAHMGMLEETAALNNFLLHFLQ